MQSGLPFMPPAASREAGPIDLLFWAINLVAIVFSVGIVIAIVFLVVKYRRGNPADRSNPPSYGMAIEIAWTGIPLLIAMGIFFWSSAVFLINRHAPAGASEIFVVGKQWMWKIQHPEGRWEMNELHVPVGRPILLTMTSEDVIHSFFVPAFRLHQDVIPGSYTHLWFTPTQVGTYHLFCSQFCGTLHSTMTGEVTVMDPAEYQAWLSTGQGPGTMAEVGKALFIQHGCDGCHGAHTSVRAPKLEGIYGRPVPVQIPRAGVPLDKIPATTVLADDRYIHDSIVLPEKEIAAGYRPIMPTFKKRLTEAEIMELTAYIKSLANQPSPDNGMPQQPLTPEEYRTRTGFLPGNMKDLSTGTADGTTTSNTNPPSPAGASGAGANQGGGR
jgi:cytochrome c oxidase subunit 2